jgi:hypothetical protein
LGSASRLVGYQTWSSSFIICIYWYWTWTVGAFGVVVRRRVHGGAARGRVSGGRGRQKKGEKCFCNPIVLCVRRCVLVRTYVRLCWVHCGVCIIHSFVFFLSPSFFFLSLSSTTLSPWCYAAVDIILWIRSLVSKPALAKRLGSLL